MAVKTGNCQKIAEKAKNPLCKWKKKALLTKHNPRKNKKASCLSNASKFITKKVILRTHKLIGDLSDIWLCSVDYSYRLLFEFAKNPKSDLDSILLLNIGSHDEVY